MAEKKTKIRFTTKSVDEKDVTLEVRRPTLAVQQKAQMAYAKAYADLVTGGALLRQRLVDVMRKQNLWDDVKEAEAQSIAERMRTASRKLPDEAGKTLDKGVTKADARTAAIELRKARGDLARLLAERNAMEANTAERLAEDARFNFYVACCTVVADTGKAYFTSVDEYLNRSEDADAYSAADHFGRLYYDIEPDFEKKLPENAFLLKYGFCDEELQLVNAEGKPVDGEGKVLEAAVSEERYAMADEEPPAPPAPVTKPATESNSL